MKGLKILCSLAVVSCIFSILKVNAVNYLDASVDVSSNAVREDRTASVKKLEDGVSQKVSNFVMSPRRELKMKMYRWGVDTNPYLVKKEMTVSPGAQYTINDASTLTANDWYYLTFRSYPNYFEATHVELIWIVN